MRHVAALIHRTAIAAIAAMVMVSCAPGPDKDMASQPGGYHEFEHGGTVYVVGSVMSAEKVRAGELLPQRINAHTPLGQPMIIESGQPGLDSRLMAEYYRRHGGR